LESERSREARNRLHRRLRLLKPAMVMNVAVILLRPKIARHPNGRIKNKIKSKIRGTIKRESRRIAHLNPLRLRRTKIEKRFSKCWTPMPTGSSVKKSL
jgi:hypothetical protein